MSALDRQLAAALAAPGDWQPTALRRAAVLCPIVVRDGKDHVLFVARHAGSHQHAGQIAFPGGMRAGDESPLATALRECREEIGVAADAIAVLGDLPARESSSGILVHCVVARLAPVALTPDPREVARVLHVPLAELRDETRWHERPPPGTVPAAQLGRQPRLSPHFAFGDELLWGLTARFVRDLLARLP